MHIYMHKKIDHCNDRFSFERVSSKSKMMGEHQHPLFAKRRKMIKGTKHRCIHSGGCNTPNARRSACNNYPDGSQI